MLKVVDAHEPPLLEAARSLLLAYAQTWVEPGEPVHEHNAAEAAVLPGKYAPPDGASLVAMSGSKAVGCIFLTRHTGSVPNAAEVKRLYVVEDQRGHRVGRTLVDAVVRRARLLGVQTLLLDVDESRKSAVALYESAGFRATEPFNDGWPGALHYARSLDS